MSLSFADALVTLDRLLAASSLFNRLGFAFCERELSEETPNLPGTCRFKLRPSEQRRLVIEFCRSQLGNYWSVVEVFNIPAEDSFLLDEWLSRRGVGLNPYPFLLSSYEGSVQERLAAFVGFLDLHLSEARLAGVLEGHDWEHIPFNWGALK